LQALPQTSQRLRKQQRLRSPKQFQKVYRSKQWGGSTHHTFNILASVDNVGNQLSRLGVTVSKKVSRQAVVRNRIKRQIREFYRVRKNDLIPCDLVITAKPSCAGAEDSQRFASLELLWQKILKWQRWYLNNQPHNSGG